MPRSSPPDWDAFDGVNRVGGEVGICDSVMRLRTGNRTDKEMLPPLSCSRRTKALQHLHDWQATSDLHAKIAQEPFPPPPHQRPHRSLKASGSRPQPQHWVNTVGTKIIADPEKCFQELISEKSLILLRDWPCL